MAKATTLYICQQCGTSNPKQLGRCPGCGAWNSMVETVERKSTALGTERVATLAAPVLLDQVGSADVDRRETAISEFDRVLGGGIVPGSLILIGGDPGIGKSTLVLQTAASLARDQRSVLYASGEESE